MSFLGKMFRSKQDLAPRPTRLRLCMSEWPAAIYAIGDVHGCVAQIRLLHQRIFADAATFPGEKLIVGLGDYVDRGVNSAGVIDFLSSPLPAGFRRICLAGNHEVMMLEHIAYPRTDDPWLKSGGVETLISYGINPSRYVAASIGERTSLLQRHIPRQHLDFLQSLPVVLALPGAVLVHAGIRQGVDLADQSESDLLWMRDLVDAGPGAPLVIHGHTPAPQPLINGRNIGIDTGAFATGILTAVRLRPDEKPLFMNVGAPDHA